MSGTKPETRGRKKKPVEIFFKIILDFLLFVTYFILIAC